MRKHFKNSFFIMVFLGTLFTSCEKDLTENQIAEPHNANFIMKTVNLNDIPDINTIVRQKLGADLQIKTKGVLAKGLTEINGVTIVKEDIKQIIENDGDKSYSFKAYDATSKNDRYNYILRDKDGIVNSILIHYKSDPNWIANNNGVFDLKTFTGMYELIDDSGNLVFQQYRINGVVGPCPPPGSGGNGSPNSGGGGNSNSGTGGYNGGTGTGTGGYGGTGGVGSGGATGGGTISYTCGCCGAHNADGNFGHDCNEPLIITLTLHRGSPIPPCFEEPIPYPDDDGVSVAGNVEPPPTPCEELKKLSDPTRTQGNIKPKVALLKQKVESANNYNEISSWVRKAANATTYTSGDYPAGTEDDVDIEITETQLGILHSHTNKKVGMYSFNDVLTLRDMYNLVYGTRKAESFSLLVCKDAFGATKYYNIKVDDFTELNNYVNNMINENNHNGALNNEDTVRKIHKKQEETYGKSNRNYEKSFLKQFKDFGISLYSASDENLTDWKKLQLNPNGTVVAVPCN